MPRYRSRLTSSIVLGALLAAGVLYTVRAGGPDPVASTQEPPTAVRHRAASPVSSTLTSTTYLPLVSADYCAAASAVPSPFALQIAALHQIEPDAQGRRLARPMTEAEWVAMYEEAFPTLLEALEESGAGWARVRISWQWIQPDPPPADYVWGPYHDEKLRLIAETGVRLIGTIADAPDWAAESPCAPFYPDRLDDFAQFLTDLVTRYMAPPYNIHHWELINEPDGARSYLWEVGLGCWADETTHEDGAAYAQMLDAAYQAIRAADPAATVLMGGVAHDWFTEYQGPFDRYFPDDVMTYGGGDAIDALSFHYFPDFAPEWERWDARSKDRHEDWLAPPTCGNYFDGEGETYEAHGLDLMAKLTHYRNRMATCFGVDRPVWVTELAEHGYANDPDSLARQARYVIQGYVRGLAAGAENIAWYALVTPNDSYEQGLLFDDWTPKPAFYAYQTMAAELDGYEYSHDRGVWELDGSDRGFSYLVEAYVFRTPCGAETTVAWGSETLPFAPASQLRVVDREGNEMVVTDGGVGDVDGVQNGSVTLQLSADPVFVQVAAR
jgi:hypothetical protein